MWNSVLTTFECGMVYLILARWRCLNNWNYLISWKNLHSFFAWILFFSFFFFGVLTTYIGLSWRSSDLLSHLAVLADCLTPFIPTMIDVRCANEPINLWWMNGNFRILYSVLEMSRVMFYCQLFMDREN